MFDSHTKNLISLAPSLDELNLDELAKELTKTYAYIVSERIRLRDLEQSPFENEDLHKTINKMRRLAFSYEAYVSFLPERQNRASAAFVAGSAHHVCLMAKKLLSKESSPSVLAFEGISTEVC
ncbi:MAG: hypothetical protein V4591_07760 [Bdellovibrionota bacterium]